MNIYKILGGFSIFANIVCAQQVDVKVVDEGGVPVEEAKVSVKYVGYDPRKDIIEKGVTDESGIFVANGEASLRVEVEVEKKGYYKSKSGRLIGKQDHQLDVIIRDKGNPIPMHAKRVATQMPGLKKFFGFDFKIGDWTMPYGEGEISDIFIKAEKEIKDFDDYEGGLIVKFNDLDEGLLEDSNWFQFSEFHSSRIAPDSAYENSERIWKRYRSSVGHDNTERKNYLMRVRIVRNEEGEIISQNYGKIYGGIEPLLGVMAPEKFGITFIYFFNPNINDRNLEFDPDQNLFKNLEQIERVYDP